jgi:hypothetical protein
MAQEPWTAERVREMMTNPIYCLSEPAIVAEDVWVAAGVKLIREIGAEKYLHMVLSNLRQTFENEFQQVPRGRTLRRRGDKHLRPKILG